MMAALAGLARTCTSRLGVERVQGHLRGPASDAALAIEQHAEGDLVKAAAWFNQSRQRFSVQSTNCDRCETRRKRRSI